jgi:hypothetical protein
MKRVALLYSGEIRNILDCFNNHYENIILPSKHEYEFDIYFHLWVAPWESNDLRNRVLQTLRPLSYEFEPYIEFKNDVIPDPRFPHPVQNFYSMFYGMDKVNKLKEKVEFSEKTNYDVVFRMRTDLFFTTPIGKIADYDPELIHIREDWAHLEYGVNDQFAFGPSDKMSKFMSTYENLEELYKMGCAINPECLMGFNAQNIHDLKIQRHKWSFWLFRHIIWNISR